MIPKTGLSFEIYQASYQDPLAEHWQMQLDDLRKRIEKYINIKLLLIQKLVNLDIE
jgi:hypothetical protein